MTKTTKAHLKNVRKTRRKWLRKREDRWIRSMPWYKLKAECKKRGLDAEGSKEQLQGLYASGHVNDYTYVWMESMGEWKEFRLAPIAANPRI